EPPRPWRLRLAGGLGPRRQRKELRRAYERARLARGAAREPRDEPPGAALAVPGGEPVGPQLGARSERDLARARRRRRRDAPLHRGENTLTLEPLVVAHRAGLGERGRRRQIAERGEEVGERGHASMLSGVEHMF